MENKLLFILVIFGTINAVKSDDMADSFSLGDIVDHISNDFDKAKTCYQQVETTFTNAVSEFKDNVVDLTAKIFDGIGLGSLFGYGQAAHKNLQGVTKTMSKFGKKLSEHFANNDKEKTKSTALKFKSSVKGILNTYQKYKKLYDKHYPQTTNEVSHQGCSFDCVTKNNKDVFDDIRDTFNKCNLIDILS